MVMIAPHMVWTVLKIINSQPRLKYGIFFSLTGCAALKYIIWNAFQYWRTQRRIEGRKKKAQGRKRLVAKQCENVDPDEIMAKHIDDLLKDLKSGKLTAVEVLQAFQKKALQVNESFNAITEAIPEALEMAKMLDSGADKQKLLHGIPVSLKENIKISGYDYTGGIANFIDQLGTDDAVIVKVLKRHGAIPFVRTNLPQSMMSMCSSNFIYGETSNPLDHTRTPGGSSSGEAALIAGGGSIIGIGSDIGGSIRVPSSFCGCYGLKPTVTRVSTKGFLKVVKGQIVVQGSACPIATDLSSLLLLCKAVMSKDMYDLDPQLPCMPFNQEKLDDTAPMRIGYYTYDGNLKCHPAVVRALMEAKSVLEKRGHTLVPIDIKEMTPPGFDPGDKVAKLIFADRFRLYKKILAHEKHEKSLKLFFVVFMLPPWLIKIIAFILSFKEKFFSDSLYAAVGFKSIYDYQVHIKKFRKWQEEFMDAWLERNLDAVICPVFPSAAPKKSTMHKLTAAGVYCQLYNGLNYPSGVLPITRVTKQDVKKTLDPAIYRATSLIEKELMKSVKGSEGMPIGVQCVALPFKEETCLRVMKEVEEGLKRQA